MLKDIKRFNTKKRHFECKAQNVAATEKQPGPVPDKEHISLWETPGLWLDKEQQIQALSGTKAAPKAPALASRAEGALAKPRESSSSTATSPEHGFRS